MEPEDFDLLIDVINEYHAALYLQVKSNEMACSIGRLNKLPPEDDYKKVQETLSAVEMITEKSREKLTRLDILKYKIQELKKKVMDSKGTLTIKDLLN